MDEISGFRGWPSKQTRAFKSKHISTQFSYERSCESLKSIEFILSSTFLLNIVNL